MSDSGWCALGCALIAAAVVAGVVVFVAAFVLGLLNASGLTIDDVLP